jgi:hypothetical protein
MERRARLAELLDGAGLAIHFSHEIEGDAPRRGDDEVLIPVEAAHRNEMMAPTLTE